MPKFGCLAGCSAFVAGARRKIPPMGGGAEPVVKADDSTGAETFTRNLAGAAGGDGALGAGADAGGGGGSTILKTDICCNSALALAVPSRLQIGHATVNGIWPLTGSTSNLYFWPQSQ